MRRAIVVLLVCLWVVAVAAESQRPAAIRIPFELSGGAIWFPVSVNGSPPQSFIFDTGAGITVINRKLAPALGVKIVREGWQENAGAGNNATQIGHVTDAVFTITPKLEVKPALSVTIPLDEVSRSFGRPMDGIIGCDLTTRYVVEIDYDAKALTLYEPSTFKYEGKGTTLPVKVVKRLGYINATVAVHGRKPVEGLFMIDSPIRDGFVFTTPFAREHRLKESVSRLAQGRGVGVGGFSNHVVGRIAFLRVGAYTVLSPAAVFPDDHAGAFARTDMAGAIGAEWLRRFRVFLDYPHSRVILEPNSHFSERWPADTTGMIVRCVPGDYRQFVVDTVGPNTPAAEGGLKAGDRILAIDGRDAREFYLWDIRAMFKKPGQTYTLRITSSSGTREVTVKTRELLE